ncbi:2-aminoethylphosphonate transport system permease PhnU [Chromobacterium violaceum]|uniref:2-aminoethylphosphonate transport system permease PhnU n=1 Tax=Chromobacterium violaceum TaxID=536 RepID=A0A3S4IZV6_CHRVL|nr:2-aminoethylphosphonate transport system permease PhnU [Chromobacterium violaceum]
MPFTVSRWRAPAAAASLLTLIPLAVIAMGLLEPDAEAWRHLAEYTLPELLRNTVVLLSGVGAGVLLLGVALAWLTAVHDFPGRRFFAWALMLPLAMPAYVMAFSQLGLFDFTGPFQTWLREAFGSSAWVPDIRSTPGVVMVLSLAFYPYVYLLARDAFAGMGRRALEVGQSLGLSPLAGFFKVALPMARPWIAGGLGLALMETLADFGTVAIFNFDAFTSAIYKAWFSLFSLSAAKQLASLLVLLVFVLLWLEQRARGQRGYVPAGRAAPLPRARLPGWRGWLASACCALVLLLAFALPFGQILVWAAEHAASELDADLLDSLKSSLALAAMAAALVPAIALLLVFAVRRDSGSRPWRGWPPWATRCRARCWRSACSRRWRRWTICCSAASAAGCRKGRPRCSRARCWSCCWPMPRVSWPSRTPRWTRRCSASAAARRRRPQPGPQRRPLAGRLYLPLLRAACSPRC